MIDVISVVLIWSISLGAAALSIYQTKGSDWYTPINSKQKMIMMLINISLLFIALAFFHSSFIVDLTKTAIVSIACLVIIIFMSRNAIREFILRCLPKHRKKALVPSSTKVGEFNDESQIQEEVEVAQSQESEDGSNSLWDLFQRVLTVFNFLFEILNIGYIVFVFTRIDDPKTIEKVFMLDNSLPVSFTILFWTTLFGSIITSKGWNYHDKIVRKIRKTPKPAKYFSDRVTNRNRK